MKIDDNRFIVGFYLARYGRSEPPQRLEVNSWPEAFDCFHEALSNGQSREQFANSIKGIRDHLDGHFEGGRRGWRDSEGKPRFSLVTPRQELYDELMNSDEKEIWNRIAVHVGQRPSMTYVQIPPQQAESRTATVGKDIAIKFFGHPNEGPGQQIFARVLTQDGPKEIAIRTRNTRPNEFRLYLKQAGIHVNHLTDILRFDKMPNNDVHLYLVSIENEKEHYEWLESLMPDKRSRQKLFKPGLSKAPSNPMVQEPQFELLLDHLADLFIGEELKEALQRSVLRKKNIILQGPPGTGKTFIAKRLARQLGGSTENGSIEMVQFHQSFGYEDFVMGYRPGESGFEAHEGIFPEFCRRAEGDPDTPHFLIIDEINRGNLSRILGELMVLIEHDKRGPEHALRLGRSEGPEDRFHVPENLHIIGTMNTADRSLGRVDYALRRRFHFHSIPPCFDASMRDHLIGLGCPEDLASHVTREMTAMNDSIADPEGDLGPGFEIGHSYFCDAPADGDWDRWLADIIDLELIPLLREYWYDKPVGDTEKFVEDLRNHRG